MTTAERALLRFLGLWAVVAGVELLERVAFRAGVDAGAAEPDVTVAAVLVFGNPDDELAPFDVSDVVEAHAECCPVPS